MTTGFEVLRSDGKVAVSSSFPHYSFIKKIRGINNFWDTSGQVYSEHVLVAFIPTTFGTNTESSYRFSRGSVVLWQSVTPITPPANATLSMHSNVQCDAYIFDIRPPTAAPSYGLVVYDTQGRITFDATARYMRVLDVIQELKAWQGKNQYGENYFNVVYPSTAKIAVVPLKFAYSNSYSSSSEEQNYRRTWESLENKNTLRVTMVSAIEDYYGSSSGSVSDLTYLALVIDVANTELL